MGFAKKLLLGILEFQLKTENANERYVSVILVGIKIEKTNAF
jgi:hypothetical protein